MEKKLFGLRKALVILLPIIVLMFLSAFMAFYSARAEESTPNTSIVTDGSNIDNIDNNPEEEVNPNPIITTEDGFKLQLSVDGTYYSVVGYAASSRNIVIPLNHKGIPIRRIGNSAFLNKKSIEHVTLNEQIERIGEGAFDGCDNLVFERDGVGGRYIGTSGNSFFYFYKPEEQRFETLKNFTVNMNAVLVAARAFDECKQIENISIPDGVKYIGYKAIGNSETLKSVTLPFVGETGDGEKNSHLGYVFGARTLGGTVSFAPKNLQEVTITDGERIAKNSFYGIDMIESLTLPYLGGNVNDTTNCIIGYIYGADNYNGNVNIPASIKNITINGGHIRYGSFYNCAKIENIVLNNVEGTGSSLFYGCDSLKSIVVDDDNPNYFSQDGILYNKTKTQFVFIPEQVEGAVVIPNGVTSIGYEAFRGCSSLTSIEIPNSVTSIENHAFYQCGSLTSITIPNSVTSIGNNAFFYCSSLIYIKNLSDIQLTFGSSDNGYLAYYAQMIEDKNGNITYRNENTVIVDDFMYEVSNGNYTLKAYIGNSDTVTLPQSVNGKSYMISNMRGVKNVIIPDTFKSIGSSAFARCYSLTSITIPNSVTSIGSYVFENCSSLTSIEIPNSVTSIGSSAFARCYSLTSITIPNSVTSIGSYVFENCSSLTSIEIPNSVTSIGRDAFSNCSSLTSIEIPNSVTSIGVGAFSGCSSLTSIEIPNSVTSIGSGVFAGCKFTEFSLVDGNQSLAYIDGVLYGDNKTKIVAVINEQENIVIPNTVTDIASAFSGCKIIKNIDFQDNSVIKSIGDYAFSGCSSLTSITIPNSVTSIGDAAFRDCSSLTSITIPIGVTSIGNRAFSGCSSLTSITIPSSVTSIGSSAFSYCSSLTSIIVQNGNTKYHSDGNCLIETSTKTLIAGCKNSVIPTDGSVTSIGDYAFSGCSSLTSIEISNSVTSIGDYAFFGCSSLTSIEISNSVTSIGNRAFSGCSSLTSIEISNSVTSIGEDAFSYCSSLTSIEIPNSVTSIGNRAFSGCSSLTSIEIPNSVTSIGDYAFSGCSSLIYIKNLSDMQFTFGSVDNGYLAYYAQMIEDKNGNITYRNENTVIVDDFMYEVSNGNYTLKAYIGNSDTVTLPQSVNGKSYMISNMRGVKNVIIPDTFTSIEYQAFFGCYSLTSITIPNSVTSIGNYAFYNCSSLTSITIPNSVTSIGNYAFYNCSSLTSITIPNSVTSIRSSAFDGCHSLTSITIPSSVTSIGSEAFRDCSSLTSITVQNRNVKYHSAGNCLIETSTKTLIAGCKNSVIPTDGSVTSIGSYVFENCSSLTSIEIPNSVTSIGNGAFYNCSSLTSITIPSSVTSIEGSAFSGCRSLTSITIPNSVTSIGNSAFYGCSSLTSITIPSSVTSIGSRAFSGCSSLTSIEIPNSLRNIGSRVFDVCTKLQQIIYSGERDEWRHIVKAGDWDKGITYTIVFASDSGAMFEANEDISEFYLAGYNGTSGTLNVKSVFAARPVTEVYAYGLYNNKSIIEVNLPETIKVIGKYAFANCSNLEQINIPDGIDKIDFGMLSGCNSLMHIDLPFLGQTVNDQNGYIGYAFGASDRMENGEYLPDTLKTVTISRSNNINHKVIENGREVGEYTQKEIAAYAFYGCTNLREIVLPDDVIAIGNYAFANCRAFTEFVIPDSVTQLGGSVLRGDNNIKYITIGNGLTVAGIADYVDDNPLFGLDKSSSSLEKYIIADGNPEFMTDGYGVLYLKLNIALNGAEQNVPVAVVDAPAMSNLSYYTLPKYIVEIMPYAFAYNSTLKTVELEYVRCIGNNAFMECDKLINVVFSDPLYDTPERLRDYIGHKQYSQRIEARAFMGCIALQKADLSVSTIIEVGEEAFLDCNVLKIVKLGDKVRKVGLKAFGASDVGGSALERIEVSAANEHFKSIEGVLFAKNGDGSITLSLYPACKPIYVDGEILYIGGETQYAEEYRIPDVDNNGNTVNVSAVESYAFSNAVYLDDLYVDSVGELRVGDYAFADSMIQHIHIGKNVTSLGLRRGEGEYTVFSGDRYLTEISVDGENRYYKSIDGVLFDKSASRLIKYPAARVGREYIIPASVDSIASMAFKDNKNIGLVTVRSNLNVVGLETFYGCSNLQVIYFNHVYAPRAVMENAFTVHLEVGADESQAVLGYSPSYYEDFGDEYGWKNYDGIYNTAAFDIAPVYEPQHGVSIYYAIVVMDGSGRTIDGTWVSITDFNGNIETVEAQNGIATFWSYANTDSSTFALSFDHKYNLMVYDGDGLYTPYVSDGVYLDGKTLVTYITLNLDMAAIKALEPSIVGVSCNGKEINSESVEINKAAFDYEQIGLKDESLGYIESNIVTTGVVHESIPVSVVAYFNNEYKDNVAENACALTQNGVAIPDCTLTDTDMRDGSVIYTFDVPVYRLVPETPVVATFTMTVKGFEYNVDTVLNINVIYFKITKDDINLDTDDVTLDLSQAGGTIMKLLGGTNMSFNIGKNVRTYIDIDDSEITVGLKGLYSKNSSNSKTNQKSLDPKIGYERYKQAHNKGSYFYTYKAIYTERREGKSLPIVHNVTYDIRFYPDPNIENYYYYRMYIYDGGVWENNIATMYGKVNGTENGIGRERVARKAQIAYLGHYAMVEHRLLTEKTKDDADFKKKVGGNAGDVYTEQEKGYYSISNSHSFSAALTGELYFKYDTDKGLHMTGGGIKGELSYIFQHNSQFMVWVIPVNLDVTVSLGGTVDIKMVVDDSRRIGLEDAKMTVEANVAADLGVGCSLASAGVTGQIGTVFILEFYPEFGVDYWNINGKIGVYAKFLWWRKDFTIWQGSYDIINRNKNQTASPLMARSMSAMYLASDYERMTPDDVDENATLFIKGGELYKIYYMDAIGRAGYDGNNFMKLAVAKWMGSDWSIGTIIDDNGCNDAEYSVFDDNGTMRIIFAQSKTKTNDALDDIYNDAGNIVVKTAAISGDSVQSVSTVTTANDNYTYLHKITVVGGVPTAVWAENADNNIFGVSPYNYIDANGISHTFATTANSVWMSRFVGGEWSAPVCLKDGLSALTNLVINEVGDVYYIEDVNGDLSDATDRVLFGKKRDSANFVAVNDATYSAVTNVYSDGDYIVYRSVANTDGVTAGLYKIKSSEASTTLVLPEESIAEMPDNYKPVYDGANNIMAYIYSDNITWKENGNAVTGSALYGIFKNGGEWSKPVIIVEAARNEYISSFDAIVGGDSVLTVTIGYTDENNSRSWQATRAVELKENIVFVGNEIDYKEQIMYVTVVNNGAVAGDVRATIDGNDVVLTNKLIGGEKQTFGIRIGTNKTPVVDLYSGARLVKHMGEVNANYADLTVFAKQIVVGGKDILLVAVRNNGNIASGGELFVASSEDTSDIEARGMRIELPNIRVGGIYYAEYALDDILSADTDIVSVLVKSATAEPSESLLVDNKCFVSYNSDTLSANDTEKQPELAASYIERTQSDNGDCVISFTDTAYYAANIYNGKTMLDGSAYTVDDINSQIVLRGSYMNTLAPGRYTFKIEFVGPDGNCLKQFDLTVRPEYIVTWRVDNGNGVAEFEQTVNDGDIPKFDSTPVHVEEEFYTYEFIGWDADSDGEADKLVAVYADTVYNAVFAKKAKQFVVTWQTDSRAFDETYSYGDYPYFAGNAEKSGFNLIGWDGNGDGKADSVDTVTRNATYTAVYEEAHTEHTPGEWIVDSEPTCYREGARHKVCVVCGETVESGVMEKIAHTPGEWAIDLDATCTREGLKHRNCSVCSEMLESTVINKLDHTEGEWIIDTAADCTHTGSRHKECSVCEQITAIEEIAKLLHNYGETLTESATCTEDGYTYHVCSVCGNEEKLSTIQSTGHTESEWIIDTAADCTHTGSRHKECSVCEQITVIEEIAATGHTESDWIIDVEADCTHKGSRHKECSVCNTITVVEEIPMVEHSYGDVQTKDATCTENGYTYKVCSVCGHEERLSTINAHGHTSNEWVVDTEAAAGVTGYHHKECTECGAIFDGEALAALPDDSGKTTIYIVLSAVCGAIAIGAVISLVIIIRKKRVIK